jgi:hypothetical protein
MACQDWDEKNRPPLPIAGLVQAMSQFDAFGNPWVSKGVAEIPLTQSSAFISDPNAQLASVRLPCDAAHLYLKL